MTNAKKTQHEQNIHQALLNEVLKHSAQAIVLLNTEAEIIFCSQNITSITGYEKEELISKTAFDFFHPTDLPAARSRHQYLVELNENTSASLIQIRNREGHAIWVDAVVKNLLHEPHINALFVLLKKSVDADTEQRKLVQAVMDAKEQEREYLASELHDNINQIITATKLLVDAARLNPDKEDLLQLSSANLQVVADEIRKLSYAMAGNDLEGKGLMVAVHAFLSTIGKACGVTFRAAFEEEAAAALTADQQLQLYRIIQEGTNNIIRHAEATLAEITLMRKKELIYLTISDNGKGFAMNRLKPGFGLSSITNRVKILRGYLHVRAPEGTGTTIEIHFPV